MTEQIIALVLDEGKWLSAAMLLSLIAVLALAARQRRQRLSTRIKIIAAMNVFYGGMIGFMSFGHLLAVTVKIFQGTLAGSLWILYPLGIVLLIPAWWLVCGAIRIASFEQPQQGKLAALNAWLGISLLALGFHNLPLAGPAALNIAYLFHSRQIVGCAIISTTAAAMLALFIASLVFLASGQSFEQFQGMP